MTTKKVATEFVTHHFCDICGEMISDGSHDGGGGVNYWGAHVNMKKGELKKIELESNPNIYSESLVITISFGWHNGKTWEVCKTCAGRIETFIETQKFRHEHNDMLEMEKSKNETQYKTAKFTGEVTELSEEGYDYVQDDLNFDAERERRSR